MKRQERKELIRSINQKITDLNDIKLLYKYYNGFNYDGMLFDFDYENYTLTISTHGNKLHLANNVDVYDKHDNYRGNYNLCLEDK